MTLVAKGYLGGQAESTTLIMLSADLVLISTASNQPVAGSIMVKQKTIIFPFVLGYCIGSDAIRSTTFDMLSADSVLFFYNFKPAFRETNHGTTP